jgi:hypothetical protein
MAFELYSYPPSGTSQNIQLIYNFDNISINKPVTKSVLTDNQFSNILTVFPLFKTNNYTGTLYNSFPINSQQSNQQISYSDNITPIPIQYNIKYLHVGVSPILLTGSNFALILDCVNSTGNILLIIIPLLENTGTINAFEDSQITPIIDNIDAASVNIDAASTYTGKPIDINKLIPATTFNTYSTGSHKVILFTTSLTYLNSTSLPGPTFMTEIKNNNTSTIPITPYSLPSTYTSLSIPTKKTIVAQNDIYIDCYKVGESANIVGGVINTDAQTNKKRKKRSILNAKNATLFYILVSIVVASILIYGLWIFFKSRLNNVANPDAVQPAAPKSGGGFFSFFKSGE